MAASANQLPRPGESSGTCGHDGRAAWLAALILAAVATASMTAARSSNVRSSVSKAGKSLNADPLSHTGEKATRRCWETIMSNATSPLWWWLDEKAIGRIVADEPSLKVALKEDPATLRLFLEIAMLVRAKTCIAKSHIGDKIVNPLRAKTGKTECVMH